MKKKGILIIALVHLVISGFIIYQTRFAYSVPEEVMSQDKFVENFEETEALEEIDELGRVGVNGNSPESKILDVMHQMTHQKIVANQKWGAVPMMTRNIEQMESIVSTSQHIQSPEVKKHLLKIIAKWERGDFS